VKPAADCGLSGHCPWPPLTFEYGGLCSHNPLQMSTSGNAEFTSDLSLQELEEIAAAVKEHNRQYQVEYGKKMRAEASDKYKTREKRNNEMQKPKTLARQQARTSLPSNVWIDSFVSQHARGIHMFVHGKQGLGGLWGWEGFS
jgi:hypothetical protein